MKKLCSRCGERERLVYSSGRVESYCRECELARKKEYSRRPEAKARAKEYYARPEVRAKKKEYMREYFSRPGNKDRMKQYQKNRYYSYEKNLPVKPLIEKFEGMGLSKETAEAFVVDGTVLDARLKELKKGVKK